MAIDHSSVQTHTDAQLLALYRDCLAKIALGQAYSINGRSFTRADMKTVMDAIDWLEERVEADAAGEEGGGNVLVQFGEA